MVTTSVLGTDEIDVEAMTDLVMEARQVHPVSAVPVTRVAVTSQVKQISEEEHNTSVIAYQGRKPIGWLNFYSGLAPMCFISSWHPVIAYVTNRKSIAHTLIEKAKESVVQQGSDRLEALFRKRDEQARAASEEYISWYKDCGFLLAAEELAMRADLTRYSVPEAPLSDSLRLTGLSQVPNSELYESYFESFLDSRDDLFLSMTRTQQEQCFEKWFSRSEPYKENASLVVTSGNRAVGFVIAREEAGILGIGPIGTVPSFRGRGIGNLLMSRCMLALKSDGFGDVFLEMSSNNTVARNLYLKHGFREQYRQVYYFWHP